MRTTSVLFLAGLWLITLVPDPVHAQCHTQQLTATNGAAGDKFGSRVDTDGSTSIISAPGFTDTGPDPDLHGRVYFFELAGDPSTWTQTEDFKGEDTNGETIRFGFDVAIQGAHALVTAPRYDSATNTNTGAVFYYHFEGSPLKWVAKQTIVRDVGDLGMGRSIAINADADAFVVGALGGESVFTDGNAYVYTRSGTTWSLRGISIRGSDTTNSDLFGFAVTMLDDDTVIAGAPFWDTSGDFGKVYGFSWDGSAWGDETFDLTISGGSSGDLFGSTVEMNSTSLLISAPGVSSAAGKVYPYEWDDTNSVWVPTTPITVSGSSDLGRTIGLDGNFAILSSHRESSAEGKVYLTVRNTNSDPPTWGTPVSFQAPSPEGGAQFGWDVSAGGVSIGIIGEPGRNLPGNDDVGAAYIFDLDCDP